VSYRASQIEQVAICRRHKPKYENAARCQAFWTIGRAIKEISAPADILKRCPNLKQGELMIIKQFQAEPSVDQMERTQPVRIPQFRTSDQAISHGALAQLLLDLRLNGKLSEENEQLLESLAVDGARVFLSGDNDIRYPLDSIPYAIELSQPDLISAESLVTRKFNDNDNHQTIVAHSARIGAGAGQPITLGIYGSERLLNDTITINKFGQVASDCRKIHKAVSRLAEQIEPWLQSESAVVIVNRASGRVIAANNAAVSLLSATSKRLIGSEYGQIKTQLRPLLTRSRMELTNISEDDIYLTALTLRPVTARSSSVFPGEFLIDQIRKKLSFVTTAISDIDIDRMPGDQTHAMIPEIFSELNQLNRMLSKLDLYICYNRHPQETVDLAAELMRLCDTIKCGKGKKVKIGQLIDNAKVTLPDSAFEFLAEAILMGHNHRSRGAAKTTLSMIRDESKGKIRISFETEFERPQDRLPYENFWRSYVGGLAAKMGIEMIHNADSIDSNTLTEIRIDQNA
jgi:hypothetical protein